MKTQQGARLYLSAAILFIALVLPSEAGSDPPAEPGETIVVTAEKDVVDSRHAVEEALESVGYKLQFRRRNKTVYRTLKVWQPKVVLYDDGRARIHGKEVSPMMIIPGSVMHILGVWSSSRTVGQMERAVADEVMPAVVEWQQAIARRGMALRLTELRGQLNRVWFEGVSAAGDTLGSAVARRGAIIAMWLNTSDTEAGEKVQETIEAFVDEVVQASKTPFTENEVRSANDRRAFAREFQPLDRQPGSQ
ncbi:MAG: hypothetical protein JXB39_05175 [Deltaproteobacteria bacterium]|nr:hypothetical protein [Deltaproteobacteria bacterium]